MKRCIAVALSTLLVVTACGGASDDIGTQADSAVVAEETTRPPEPTPEGGGAPAEPSPQQEPQSSPDADELTAIDPAKAPDADGQKVDQGGEEDQTSDEDSMAGEAEPNRWATTPLDRYWGFADLSGDEFVAMRSAEEHEINELVAACMADQGFEYIPWVTTVPNTWQGAELSDEEYRQQYGYGITTTIDEVRPAPAPDGRPENPNRKIQEAMSPGERAAYDRALHGDHRTITEGTPLEERGCWGRADLEVRGEEYALDDLLGQERKALQQRIEHDPRVVAATVEWSRCMSAAGFAYNSPEEANQDIARRAEPFQMLGDPYEVLSPEEINAMTPAELEVVVAELQVLSPQLQAELDALQEYELAVAAADYECGLPLEDVRYEVTVEMEQAFVDEHLSTLEAIVVSR